MDQNQQPQLQSCDEKFIQSVKDSYEHYLILASEERRIIPRDNVQFIPQVYRQQLNNWIIQLSKDVKLSCQCKQLAIYLSDTFLSHHQLNQDALQLLAITALIDSTKFLETKQLKFSYASYITCNKYSEKQVEAMEKLLVNDFRWNLKIITPSEFSEYILKQFFPQVKANFSQIIEDIMDYCLSENDFTSQLPSTIALGCLLLGAEICGLNQEIAQLVWFVSQLSNKNEIIELYKIIKKKFDESSQQDLEGESEQTEQESKSTQYSSIQSPLSSPDENSSCSINSQSIASSQNSHQENSQNEDSLEAKEDIQEVQQNFQQKLNLNSIPPKKFTYNQLQIEIESS